MPVTFTFEVEVDGTGKYVKVIDLHSEETLLDGRENVSGVKKIPGVENKGGDEPWGLVVISVCARPASECESVKDQPIRVTPSSRCIIPDNVRETSCNIHGTKSLGTESDTQNGAQ